MASDSESDNEVKRRDSSDDEVQRSDDEVQRSDLEDNEDDIPSPPMSRSPTPSGSDDGHRRRDSRSQDEEESEARNEQEGTSPTSEKSDNHSRQGSDEDAAQTTAKDIFGSDMSSEDEDDEDTSRKRRDSSSQERSPPRRQGDDDSEDAVDDEERARRHQAMREESYMNDMEGEDGEGRVEDGREELPEVTINAEIPRLIADLGKEFNFVKFPNFLSVETHPFDPNTHEDEIDEEDLLDDEGKGRLKLKVENTIRWRTVLNPKTQEEKQESNARIVRWSDGSSSLYLGSEIFDIHKQEMIQGENNHLFVRQGVGLQGQAVFRTKLSFRPHSTDSFTHRKMTLSLADKSQKTHKIRVLPNVGHDPEAHRSEMIKKEEDRLKASLRRDNKVRRTRERAHGRGPSASYLEPDQYDDDDEDGISLSAIKNKFKRKEFAATAYSDSDDGSDLEFNRKSSDKKKQARIQESDDDD